MILISSSNLMETLFCLNFLLVQAHFESLRLSDFEDKEIPLLLNWKGTKSQDNDSKKDNKWYWPWLSKDFSWDENLVNPPRNGSSNQMKRRAYQPSSNIAIRSNCNNNITFVNEGKPNSHINEAKSGSTSSQFFSYNKNENYQNLADDSVKNNSKNVKSLFAPHPKSTSFPIHKTTEKCELVENHFELKTESKQSDFKRSDSCDGLPSDCGVTDFKKKGNITELKEENHSKLLNISNFSTTGCSHFPYSESVNESLTFSKFTEQLINKTEYFNIKNETFLPIKNIFKKVNQEKNTNIKFSDEKQLMNQKPTAEFVLKRVPKWIRISRHQFPYQAKQYQPNDHKTKKILNRLSQSDLKKLYQLKIPPEGYKKYFEANLIIPHYQMNFHKIYNNLYSKRMILRFNHSRDTNTKTKFVRIYRLANNKFPNFPYYNLTKTKSDSKNADEIRNKKLIIPREFASTNFYRQYLIKRPKKIFLRSVDENIKGPQNISRGTRITRSIANELGSDKKLNLRLRRELHKLLDYRRTLAEGLRIREETRKFIHDHRYVTPIKDKTLNDPPWTLEEEEEANYGPEPFNRNQPSNNTVKHQINNKDEWHALDKELQEDFLIRRNSQIQEECSSRKGLLSAITSYFHWLRFY